MADTSHVCGHKVIEVKDSIHAMEPDEGELICLILADFIRCTADDMAVGIDGLALGLMIIWGGDGAHALILIPDEGPFFIVDVHI